MEPSNSNSGKRNGRFNDAQFSELIALREKGMSQDSISAPRNFRSEKAIREYEKLDLKSPSVKSVLQSCHAHEKEFDVMFNKVQQASQQVGSIKDCLLGLLSVSEFDYKRMNQKAMFNDPSKELEVQKKVVAFRNTIKRIVDEQQAEKENLATMTRSLDYCVSSIGRLQDRLNNHLALDHNTLQKFKNKEFAEHEKSLRLLENTVSENIREYGKHEKSLRLLENTVSENIQEYGKHEKSLRRLESKVSQHIQEYVEYFHDLNPRQLSKSMKILDEAISEAKEVKKLKNSLDKSFLSIRNDSENLKKEFSKFQNTLQKEVNGNFDLLRSELNSMQTQLSQRITDLQQSENLLKEKIASHSDKIKWNREHIELIHKHQSDIARQMIYLSRKFEEDRGQHNLQMRKANENDNRLGLNLKRSFEHVQRIEKFLNENAEINILSLLLPYKENSLQMNQLTSEDKYGVKTSSKSVSRQRKNSIQVNLQHLLLEKDSATEEQSSSVTALKKKPFRREQTKEKGKRQEASQLSMQSPMQSPIQSPKQFVGKADETLNIWKLAGYKQRSFSKLKY